MMRIFHTVRAAAAASGLAALAAGPLAMAQGAGSTQPLVLTLDRAISIALEQNRDVLIADQDRYKSDARVAEARSGALPQVSLSGQYMRYINKPVLFLPPNTPPINPTSSTAKFEIGSDNAYQAGLTVSQVLYSQALGTAMEIAAKYHEYSDESYRGTSEDVVLQVKQTFYGVLLMKKLVDANRQGLDVVKANLDNIRAQQRHGTAAEFDLLRAEVQLANTEPQVITAENNLLLAADALKNLLSIPLGQDIRVEGTFAFEEVPADSLARARSAAMAMNPTVTQLALQESMLDLNVDIERSNHFPTLALFGSYLWQAQDNSFQFRNYNWANTFNVGLSLSLPIFDGFRTSARVDQANVDLQKLKYTRLKVEEGLRIQIRSAELRMAEAKKRIEGQEKNIMQAEKAVHIAQTRYKSGVGTQLELLDTQVAMTRAQTNYAQAIYDHLIAKAEWQRAVGRE